MVKTQELNQFVGLDKALNEGLSLRAFTSGGGLRVVRIEVPHERRNGQLKGYGEHPHLREALMFASMNYMAGGGNHETHYLTGSQNIDDPLDGWLLGGNRLSAGKAFGNVRLEANDCNYSQVVVAVEASTFTEAYSGISRIIQPHHFDIAKGF